MANVWMKWVVEPLRGLLMLGATPERLAWSLAVGIVVGINPLLGSTTVLALAIAGVFRLNVVASQVGNHVMYPVELVLFPVFVKLGSMVFRTEKLPMDGKELWWAVKHHPWETTRTLWRWEWHAMVVWAVFAAVAMPVIAMALRPALRAMLRRVQGREVVQG